MNKLTFDTSNNWNEFPELKQNINWLQAPENNAHIMHVTNVSGNEWKIRVNDFPDEPCYTLIINNKEIMHFDDWPSFWDRTD